MHYANFADDVYRRIGHRRRQTNLNKRPLMPLSVDQQQTTK